MAGEPGPTTILLQTRLTAVPTMTDGRVPGAVGMVRFEFSESPELAAPRVTDWLPARAEDDFIVKAHLTGLKPGTVYHYRARFGADASAAEAGAIAQFRTLAAPDAPSPVRFVVLNCMHYARFMGHVPEAPKRPLAPEERAAGYPGFAAVRKLAPDFWVSAGDNVYYDNPKDNPAATIEAMRHKWHEQGVLPRVRDLFGAAAAFFMKDDHDFRYDDADLTGEKAPAPALGIRLFREQVPVIAPTTPRAPTYRTVRAGRDTQLWFLEGRDYRSSNQAPDGPGKTIWGAEQSAWLRRTLLASDASFKIIVSPTPLVGPDDASKADNHTNLGGFRNEGAEFFAWLTDSRLDPSRVILITGDRHWKYHSVHPSGFSEWSCGSIVFENSRLGRAPGDPKSTDPDARIRQPYTDVRPLGGFLLVEIAREAGTPRATFSLRDEAGAELFGRRYPADGDRP